MKCIKVILFSLLLLGVQPNFGSTLSLPAHGQRSSSLAVPSENNVHYMHSTEIKTPKKELTIPYTKRISRPPSDEDEPAPVLSILLNDETLRAGSRLAPSENKNQEHKSSVSKKPAATKEKILTHALNSRAWYVASRVYYAHSREKELSCIHGDVIAMSYAIDTQKGDITTDLIVRQFKGLSKEQKIELINKPDIFGRTPLHYASGLAKVSIVKLLLDHGANPVATDDDHRLPIHYAAGISFILPALMTMGSDLVDNKKSESPDLTEQDRIKIITMLRTENMSGLDLLDIRDNAYGKTPLDYAKDLGYTKIVEHFSPQKNNCSCTIL